MMITHMLRIWIDHEYCVYAADLPGCASQATTIDSCVESIIEAFICVVQSHGISDEEIPWIPMEDRKSRPLFNEELILVIELDIQTGGFSWRYSSDKVFTGPRQI